MSRIDFRAAMVGGLAFAAMVGPVQADELSSLKTQLLELQGKVDRLEADSRPSAKPQSSWISFKRGTGATAQWNTQRPGERLPADGGFTIAVTPSGDMPAPTHEVTVSGYVKGDVIYDFDQDLGDVFSYTRIGDTKKQDHVRLHGRQTRFSIKSTSDTAVGQIRTFLESDFMSDGSFGKADLRLRHAWGEWDITSSWTLGAGQHWQNFMSPFTGITTVDMNGDVGLIGRSRNAQVRLTWTDGPALIAMSLENPTAEKGDLAKAGSTIDVGANPTKAPGTSDNLPDLNVRMQYDIPGGHQLLLSGLLRNYHLDRPLGGQSASELGWGVQGAANIQLGELAMITGSAMYGEGLGSYLYGPQFGAFSKNGRIELVEQLGVFAGITFNVMDATTLNLGWGYVDQNDADIKASGIKNANIDMMSAHANVIWEPVSQLRLGAEIMWGQREFTKDTAGSLATKDAWRGQFGAWFFF